MSVINKIIVTTRVNITNQINNNINLVSKMAKSQITKTYIMFKC